MIKFEIFIFKQISKKLSLNFCMFFFFFFFFFFFKKTNILIATVPFPQGGKKKKINTYHLFKSRVTLVKVTIVILYLLTKVTTI